MKKGKLNESENSSVLFITFIPDDYHGAPEIRATFPPGNFPEIPTREEVFDAWSNAGYNAFSAGDWDGDWDDAEARGEAERESFYEYGDFELYYSVYMIIIEDKNQTRRILDEIVEELSNSVYEERNPDSEDAVDIMKNIKGVTFAGVALT